MEAKSVEAELKNTIPFSRFNCGHGMIFGHCASPGVGNTELP